jgi:hypothetical protein
MEQWRFSSSILDFSTRTRWIISFTPWPLYHQGNRLQYPFEMKLGGPQSRSGRCGENKNVVLSGIEPGPARSTELSQLFQYTFSELKCYGRFQDPCTSTPSKGIQKLHQLYFFLKQNSLRNDKHSDLPFIFVISGKDLWLKKWVRGVRGCIYKDEDWNCLVNSS